VSIGQKVCTPPRKYFKQVSFIRKISYLCLLFYSTLYPNMLWYLCPLLFESQVTEVLLQIQRLILQNLIVANPHSSKQCRVRSDLDTGNAH